MKALEDKVDACLTGITELKTLWNGGPGCWEVCKQHCEAMKDHEQRIRKLTKYANYVVGVILFLGFIFGAVEAVGLFLNHDYKPKVADIAKPEPGYTAGVTTNIMDGLGVIPTTHN